MANYWIKLYHEILDDPLMATMPDRLWRRTIELFLVCGRFSDDGCLPNSKQIAWILRADITSIENDLQEIAALGIITETENGWAVKNFKKRQAPSSSTERSKAFREKERKYYCNENATEMQRTVAQIQRDTDNRSDTEENAAAPSRKGALDQEAEIFQRALSITNEKLTLTDERRRVLFEVIKHKDIGISKFMLAVKNLVSSSWPTKSLTYFLDNKFDAVNRVDRFANAPPVANGNSPPQKTVMDAPPELKAIFNRTKRANTTT